MEWHFLSSHIRKPYSIQFLTLLNQKHLEIKRGRTFAEDFSNAPI